MDSLQGIGYKPSHHFVQQPSPFQLGTRYDPYPNRRYGAVLEEFFFLSHLETAVWFMFDDSLKISQYDITFRRLEWAWDYVKPFLQPQLKEELGSVADNCNDVDDLIHLRAAIDICNQHETYCVGSLQQYNSTQACIDYIYHTTPLGKVYEWGGDSGKPFSLSWRCPVLIIALCVHSDVQIHPQR
jgi:hypothetical protein